MPTYRRKDWIKEAIGISIVLHIVLIFLSYFFTIKPVQEIFYVTMYQEQEQEQNIPPVIDKQPVKAKPVPISSELEPEVGEFDEAVDSTVVRKDVEQSLSEIRSLLQSNSQSRKEAESNTSMQEAIIEETLPIAEAVEETIREPVPPVNPPVQPQPKVPPKTNNPPPIRENPRPIPSPPPKPEVKEEPTPIAQQETPTKELPNDVVMDEKESLNSEVKQDSDEQERSSLGEEWDFLTKDSGSDEAQKEKMSNQAVGEALYSMQFASRKVLKAPDFSFLESGKFYTNSAFIRVRLSILADGSVIQAVLVDGGSGDSELDRLILESLLGMIFNDVSAQRSTTQIGVITIRFG